MEKFLLTVLRVELIAAPFVFGWAIHEYCQCRKAERELYESFAETEAMLDAVNEKWID